MKEAGPGDVVVVLVTVPSADVGEKMARAVVEEHLAACVNIAPGIRSFFWWEERVQEESELLLVVKTSPDQLPALEHRVRSLHPYSVPEFIALPVIGGLKPYLAWVSDAVTAKGGGAPDEE